MFTQVHPKLPMRNKEITRAFYIQKLGFQDIGLHDYNGYLMLRKDAIEIHFFEFSKIFSNAIINNHRVVNGITNQRQNRGQHS